MIVEISGALTIIAAIMTACYTLFYKKQSLDLSTLVVVMASVFTIPLALVLIAFPFLPDMELDMDNFTLPILIAGVALIYIAVKSICDAVRFEPPDRERKRSED